MNGNFQFEDNRQESDRKGEMAQLPEISEAVKEMVEQMKCTSMEFEDDQNDACERAMVSRGEKVSIPNRGRPTNMKNCTGYSTPRETGRERVLSNSGNMCLNSYSIEYDPTRDQRDQASCDNPQIKKINQQVFPFRGKGYHRPKNRPVSQPSRPSNGNKQRNRHGRKGYRSSSASYVEYSSLEYYDYGMESNDPSYLVYVLSESTDFRASLLQLMEIAELKPSDVRQIISCYRDVFELENEIVILRPKIKLCNDHSNAGCPNQSSCMKLHICPMYVSSYCTDKSCVIGHRWFTDHNKLILQSFHIKEVQVQNLRKLMKSVLASCGPSGNLSVCKDYNGNGCNKQECDSLHICKSFLANRTKCTTSGCKYNHDILSNNCRHLLVQHGFSTNEAPRDIVVAILSANPSVVPLVESKSQKPVISKKESNNDALSDKKVIVLASKTTPQKDTSDSSDDGTEETEKNSKKSKDTRTKGSQIEDLEKDVVVLKVSKKRKPSGTVWSHEYHGDTKIAEICYYSVESRCRNEGTGCSRLHSITPYHWQISEQGSNWLNLSFQQVQELEQAFCNTNPVDEITLRLDPSKMESSLKNLFKFMGCDKWKANFPAMIMTNSDYSRVIYLRRLGIESVGNANSDEQDPRGNAVIKEAKIPGSNPDIKVTRSSNSAHSGTGKARWYFLDINNKWVEYGNVDTSGERTLVSNVTSDDIERHYNQNPDLPLSFKNSKYTYILDLNAMTQTNKDTNVVRQVCRRPDPNVQVNRNYINTRASTGDVFPSTWEPMQPQERMRLVNLTPDSSEYQNALDLFSGNILTPRSSRYQNPFGPSSGNILTPRSSRYQNPFGPSSGNALHILNSLSRRTSQLPDSNAIKIERIQNPFLWKAFQNKVNEMTTVYGSLQKVDVRQLFHGTSANAVPGICAENFDWRLHGTSSGQSHGRGTYFSPQPSTSMGYCKFDYSGVGYIFIARVAVGSITHGNSSMARPPINPETQAPFDSTGDGVSVVVKYDKQEYYPEYLITFRKNAA